MRIDSHQHFWVYDESNYPWIPRATPLHRDWLPADLEPLLAANGFSGTIAVQARSTIEESHWLLTLADHSPLIKGVVGWVDLLHPRVEEQLATFAEQARFVGVRHILQEEDERFMLRPEFVRGIAKLAQFNLTYDLLIYPRHLPAAIELVGKFPGQPFVLDHIAKPLIAAKTLSPWREGIKELAAAPHVFCKISGMITEADHRQWRADDLQPYMETVFEFFGAKRLMFGSDWPVCLLAGSYQRVFAVVDNFLTEHASAAREAVLGENAARFYLRR